MALLFRPDAVSRRTPDIAPFFNSADMIERYLQLDGHKTWGWVIYRSTYNSEEEWQEFLRRLHAQIEASLKSFGGLDIYDSLGFKVFEDQTLFDGASTATIREHFKTWAETASQEEQGTGRGQSQRYQFCIQVDTEALHSVVYEANPSDRLERGWVKLIWKDWECEALDLRDMPEEPIEGVTVKEIGWSRAAYASVMVSIYAMIRGHYNWYTEYRRPPTIIISWSFKLCTKIGVVNQSENSSL